MYKHKSKEFKIYYYSERGLINLFIQELVKLKTDKKRKKVIEYILDKLKTGDGGKDPKIKDKDKYKWFNLVVEPSFGQFGDPDLLILTSTGKGGKYHCFFVEAKRDSLSDALKQKNTSNIVCQLINKIKLAEAVKNNGEIKYQTKKLKNKASLDIINLILSEGTTKEKALKENTVFHYIVLTRKNNDKENMDPNNSKLKNIISESCENNDLTLWVKNWNAGRITFLTYDQIATAFNDKKVEESFDYVLKYYENDKSV